MAPVANGAQDAMNQADHDLLIEVKTVVYDIRDTLRDHEARQRATEKTVIELEGSVKDLKQDHEEFKASATTKLDAVTEAGHRLDRRTVILACLIASGGGGAGAVLASFMNGFFH